MCHENLSPFYSPSALFVEIGLEYLQMSEQRHPDLLPASPQPAGQPSRFDAYNADL